MTPAFDKVSQVLRRLPGLGRRSAERLALHLLVEQPERLPEVLQALQEAASRIQACTACGNVAEGELCSVCENPNRDTTRLCIVEQVPDLVAMEQAGAFNGLYHVLHGKFSPSQGKGIDALNVQGLGQRIEQLGVQEVLLALANDVEGEATCRYLEESFLREAGVTITRIGFGLPSGGGLVYADARTLKSAVEGRRQYS